MANALATHDVMVSGNVYCIDIDDVVSSALQIVTQAVSFQGRANKCFHTLENANKTFRHELRRVNVARES